LIVYKKINHIISRCRRFVAFPTTYDYPREKWRNH
jgi:hypothetical protein